MLWFYRSSRCFKPCLTALSSSSSSITTLTTNFKCHFQLSPVIGRNINFSLHTRHKSKESLEILNDYCRKTVVQQQTPRRMSEQVEYLDTPERSETDKKVYKWVYNTVSQIYHTIDDQIRVCLLHDTCWLRVSSIDDRQKSDKLTGPSQIDRCSKEKANMDPRKWLNVYM